MNKEVTVQKSVNKICYKHTMSGGGGAYLRRILNKGDIVQLISINENNFATVECKGKTIRGIEASLLK